MTCKKINNMRRFITLIAVLLAVIDVNAQDLNSTGINPYNFRMDMTLVSPRRFPDRLLGGGEFFVKVENDSLQCYLPYFGEVYQYAFNDDGLNFTVPIKQIEVKPLKKNRMLISMYVTKGNVSYIFKFRMYPDHTGTLDLFPINAQSISYEGDWSEAH